MFLNRCHFIAEPDGDFVNTFSSGNQKTGEGMPHRMRRYPLASLRVHVFREGRPEIVAIKPFSMGDIGPEHEWRPHAIGLEKFLKFDRERNRSLLAIFKIHGGGFAQVKVAGLKVKPERPRFDDFLEAQTGVESAEKEKPQVLIGRFSNQPVAKVVCAEIFARTSNGPRYLHILHRIATGDSSRLNCPAEERTQGHHISKRGCVSGALQRVVVETLNLPRRNGSGGRTWRQRMGKKKEFVPFRDRAGTRVFLLTRFVGDESIDLGVNRSAGFDVDMLSHRFRSAHSLGRIGRFKCNEVAFTVSLNSKPVNVAAKIDAATKFASVTRRHLRGLSHTYCHTFNKKIGDLALHRDTIIGDNIAESCKKTLLRRWFRVRVPADPMSEWDACALHHRQQVAQRILLSIQAKTNKPAAAAALQSRSGSSPTCKT
jgi:hypothetical protein